jgi:hypothetical protein
VRIGPRRLKPALWFSERLSREESDPKEIDEIGIFLAAVFTKSSKLEEKHGRIF